MADVPAPAVPAAAPAAPAEPQEAASGGYCICVCVSADGKMMVGTKPLTPEDATEGMSPASSIREAMAMAMDIYKNNGDMPDESEDADFAAGFGKPAAPVVQKQRDNEDMA